jgi:hypothetical protein
VYNGRHGTHAVKGQIQMKHHKLTRQVLTFNFPGTKRAEANGAMAKGLLVGPAAFLALEAGRRRAKRPITLAKVWEARK